MKTLKYLIVLSILILSSELIKAQNYNPIINYSFNDTPVHGVKIKTNIPFINQQGMPTIIIEGYNYFEKQPIGLIFNWYIYENEFVNSSISSFGAYTPEVKLSNENGKVVIFINDKKYFNRFTVRGFASGMHEDISWFSNWSIADEPLSGTKTITIPYKNTVGELNFPAGIITNNGNVGIGTTNPQTKLDVNGNISIASGYPIQLAGNQPYHGIQYSNNGFANTFIDGPVIYGWSGGGLGIKREIGESLALKWNAAGNVAITNKLEAKEIKVTTTPTADFVFEDSYQLPDLENVEKHIKENKHLPEIASAAEMQKEGVNIGDFQIKLLQKIEELTLYSIEHNKQNKEQQERILKLEEQVKALLHN